MRLLVFGFGDSARALWRRLEPRGWTAVGAIRAAGDRARLESLGVEPLLLGQGRSLAEQASQADAILVTAPPTADGCPGLRQLAPALSGRRLGWLGYLSTTGVYGDRRGRWVTEESSLNAQSMEGARRVAAERDWRTTAESLRLPLAIFRLPGLYAAGRSPLDRLREGRARRIASPGHVFSRLHLDDLASGLEASMARPRPCGIYNLCDDEPCPNSEVIAYAASLLGMDPPPEIPLDGAGLSPAALRFYAESKRVSNARAKAELGWRPAYPSYREGLAAILGSGG